MSPKVIPSTPIDRENPLMPEWTIAENYVPGELRISYARSTSATNRHVTCDVPLSATVARRLALALYQAADEIDPPCVRAEVMGKSESGEEERPWKESPMWSALKDQIFGKRHDER